MNRSSKLPRIAVGHLHPGDLFVVRLVTTKGFAPLVDAGLEQLGVDSVAWYLDRRRRVRFEFYFESRREARERADLLRGALREWAEGEPWSVESFRVSPQDWSEYWKRHFRITRVSRRIVIKPSWETYRPKPADLVIEIDPGMAFGTGQHFSTSSCLRLMEWLVAGGRGVSRQKHPSSPLPLVLRPSFLDLGCGSGILSIAAAKLGFRDVLGIDNDPVVIPIARQNFRRNGVKVRARVMDLDGLRLGRTFDVVAANMYSGLLERFAAAIAGTVRADPPGHLVLSGILTPQYARVRQAFRKHGFREVRRLHDREWTSGCFVREERRSLPGFVRDLPRSPTV